MPSRDSLVVTLHRPPLIADHSHWTQHFRLTSSKLVCCRTGQKLRIGRMARLTWLKSKLKETIQTNKKRLIYWTVFGKKRASLWVHATEFGEYAMGSIVTIVANCTFSFHISHYDFLLALVFLPLHLAAPSKSRWWWERQWKENRKFGWN